MVGIKTLLWKKKALTGSWKHSYLLGMHASPKYWSWNEVSELSTRAIRFAERKLGRWSVKPSCWNWWPSWPFTNINFDKLMVISYFLYSLKSAWIEPYSLQSVAHVTVDHHDTCTWVYFSQTIELRVPNNGLSALPCKQKHHNRSHSSVVLDLGLACAITSDQDIVISKYMCCIHTALAKKIHVTWNFAVPVPHSEEIWRCILLFFYTLDRSNQWKGKGKGEIWQ